MLKGRVFNIQRFSTHDGPGVRTVVFFCGCPLRCFWCQNPESQPVSQVLMHKSNLCIGCGKCESVCQYNAVNIVNGVAVIDREKCTVCGDCAGVCAVEGLTVSGYEISVEDVMKIILKDRSHYLNSGGGVTLSGGEATMQIDFAEAILNECSSKYIHTTLETCGYMPKEYLLRLMPYVDLFMYDIKAVDDEKHIAGTGCSNKIILANAEEIAKSGKSIIIRMPLIPGYNDSKEDVLLLKEYVTTKLGLESSCIELLKYNNLGETKHANMGKDTIPRYNPQSEEYFQMLCDLLK